MTKRYKVIINDRKYTSWSYIPEEGFDNCHKDEIDQIAPVKHFSKDILLYDPSSNTIETFFSHIRSGTPLAGILVLEDNRTYGRANKTKSKLLYKVIPDDNHLPAFLVPYDPSIGFSKVFKNKYVVFKFEHWNDQHPHGSLLSTIGETNHLESFYEYQLYCKNLHVSINHFTSKTREQLQKQTNEEYIEQILKNPDFHIEDRRKTAKPFTIDPIGSLDFDDAFSIIEAPDNTLHLTIYIANVYVWLETLHLWKSFANRVSTIYLPDKKRPMLPTILSDSLCSLQENNPRFALALDLIINPTTGEILRTSFKNTIITVTKNYRYEEPALIQHPPYQSLYDISQLLDKNVSDSHDIVSYWMIRMNTICGEHLATLQQGIYRKATIINPQSNIIPLGLPTETQRIINNWNSVSGQYVLFQSDVSHEVLKTKYYAHITSPIRRLVDLLNMMILSIHPKYKLIENPSQEAHHFLTEWIKNIDYLNTSMRSIRKIQTNCELLYRCITTPSLIQTPQIGILFDKLQKNDGGFVYMVYLEGVQMLSRLKTYVEYENYSKHSFQLFLFEDEHNLKRKIRIQIVQ
jgi:exoribonuclease R